MKQGQSTQTNYRSKFKFLILLILLILFISPSCRSKRIALPTSNFKINNTSLSKNLESNGDKIFPGDPTTLFSSTDDAVISSIEYENLTGQHTFRWEWIDPAGMLYLDSGCYEVSSIPNSSIEHGYAWHQINIKDEKAENKPGTWKVIVYIDDQMIAANKFHLSSSAPPVAPKVYCMSVTKNQPSSSSSPPTTFLSNTRHQSSTGNKAEAEDFSTYRADVDTDIPRTSMTRPNAIAVVIGNRTYQNKDLPNVEYAIRDARIMKEYMIQTLGVEPGNIIYKTDISKSGFEAIFGNFRDYRGRLYNYVKPEISEIFVFYSGHGAPDPNSKKGYFLPVDCEPDAINLNGYPLELFYNNLSKINAKQIVVVLDACFSGGLNSGETFINSASPALLTVKNSFPVSPNISVLASSKSNQISSWYDDKKHGLFTYFFLKALSGDADQNKDEVITLKEVYDYVANTSDGVPYWARRLHDGRVQEPVLIGKNQNFILVKY